MMYESGEDYLESILVITKEKGFTRAVDIAKRQDVSKPSVSRAMGILKENGYITIGEKQHILLTEKGLKKAEAVYERHVLFTKFLANIANVSDEVAEKNACRMEHVIDDEVLDGIKNWMSANIK